MHHKSLFSSLWDVVAYEAFLLCFPWRTWKRLKQYTTDAVGGCWRNPAVPAALPMLVWSANASHIWFFWYYLILFDIIWYYLILFGVIWSSKENNAQRLWGAQTQHQAVSLGTFAAGSAFSQRLKQCLLHPSASRCIPVHPGASRCIPVHPGIGHWTSAAIFYMKSMYTYHQYARSRYCVYITITVYSSFYHDIHVCVCFLFLSSFGPRSKPFRIRGTLAILSFRMLKFWCVEWSHFFFCW